MLPHHHLSLLLLTTSASAHQMMTTLHTSTTSFGDGTCILVPQTTSPLQDPTHPSIVCNTVTPGPVRTCCIEAGQSLSFEWRTWPDGSQNGPIDQSHQGPCAVYMKRIADGFGGGGGAAGAGWFKVWHDGYRDGEFCVERLRKSGGMMRVTVPRDLAEGDYLVRAETLALHQAHTIGGAQWYVSCAQLHVYSTGGDASPPTVSIPGYTHPTHPGIHFDLYRIPLQLPYVIPGPEPYVPTAAGGGRRVRTVDDPRCKACAVANANWCSAPLSPFNSEAECYASTGQCWQQLQACYNQATATGSKGCKIWESKCQSFVEHCKKCGAERNCKGAFSE